MTVRVLLADDQPLLRQGFAMIIDAEADLSVVGEAEDGAHAVELAGGLRPDVVLMDVRMPGMDGIEATRRIVTEQTAVRVIILTTFDLDEYAFAALRAGASGFLLKNTPAGGPAGQHPHRRHRRRSHRAQHHAAPSGQLRRDLHNPRTGRRGRSGPPRRPDRART